MLSVKAHDPLSVAFSACCRSDVQHGLTGQNAIGSLEASGYVLLASSYVMRVRVQAYESAAQMASVYSLGKQESTAAVALLHKIPGPIKAEALQRNCGGFLCCLDVFLSKVPKDFADKAEKETRDRAAEHLGHLLIDEAVQLCSAVGEWGRACWSLQKQLLNEDDMMERIPDLVQKKLEQNPDFLKKCQEEISDDPKFTQSLKTWHAGSNPAPSSSTTTGPAPRTIATPEWGTSDGPRNVRKRASLDEVPLSDFESGNVTLVYRFIVFGSYRDGMGICGMANIGGKPDLFIVWTESNQLWILNKGGSVGSLSAQELFGFNTGTFVELPSGLDSALIVMSDDKSITSLADLICKLAGERGVTEVRVVDHSVVPKVKVNSFRPKELAADAPKLNLRPAMFGAKAKVAAKAKAKETVASGSSKTVKRPAASKPAAKPAATSGATAPDGKKRGPPKKDITVGKGPYKNGTYGFKINGAQKMLAAMVDAALKKVKPGGMAERQPDPLEQIDADEGGMEDGEEEACEEDEAEQTGAKWDDTRLSLIGNSWHVGVVAWLLEQLLGPLGFCRRQSVQEIVDYLTPGGSRTLQGMLLRPPLMSTKRLVTSLEKPLLLKLLGLVSMKGEDLMVTAASEPQVKFHRLRSNANPATSWPAGKPAYTTEYTEDEHSGFPEYDLSDPKGSFEKVGRMILQERPPSIPSIHPVAFVWISFICLAVWGVASGWVVVALGGAEMVGELPGLYELPPKEAAPGTENSGRNRELSMRGANRELSAAAKAQRGFLGRKVLGVQYVTCLRTDRVGSLVAEDVPVRQGGKMNRGLIVVETGVMLLKHQGREVTNADLHRFAVLGWAVEYLQACMLMADDMMDGSVTRRGNPCWYRLPEVGLLNTNDFLMVEMYVYKIVKRHFGKEQIFPWLIDLLLETTFQTECGQLLDSICANCDLEVRWCSLGALDRELTTERWTLIVTLGVHRVDQVDRREDDDVVVRWKGPEVEAGKYKTAFYSFYLPVALAMLVTGVRDHKAFDTAREALLCPGGMGELREASLDGRRWLEVRSCCSCSSCCCCCCCCCSRFCCYFIAFRGTLEGMDPRSDWELQVWISSDHA
ncbi:6E)-farnesyl diphosphate synthase) (Dimethylallyltranstransferase) (Farnesyl diphosphate synthase) (Geranyltranstransferase) [Durusdinium trenchii]|uniref:6E-farnesyl diphosphate synthase (Dimethylallyltranstransferase (Farnesyl diphosphate synthase (Geranyltranstransferase n=1 Tax=Durusdinium trenchii TaxID=1381693 RepID=A0ABP0JLG1_9DINO